MTSVYVKTLGCKVNAFDGHAIENQFRARGYELLSSPDGADVTVVNTCSVTANAGREARYLARRLRKSNPKSVVVFTGCYAQTDSARLVAMDEIDLVVPNESKERLVEIVSAAQLGDLRGVTAKMPSGVTSVTDNKQSQFKSSVTIFDHAESRQTRAYVKVQDGCDGFCTYCLIPYARGASRSVPKALVVAEAERLIGLGTREVVLTGIHIGDYGRDLPEHAGESHPIVGLLRTLFELPGMARLRISSLEPSELSQPLADLLAEHAPLVCDHAHLPLQSGSDRILKKMRRTYDRGAYRDAVHRFRAYFPEASIGADVLPGFPGESDADFQDTVALCEELRLSYLHVFPYSLRPNTAAARMPDHLDGTVIKERSAALRRLSESLASDYSRAFIGRTFPVLWENDVDTQGRRLGRTPNYLVVAAAAPATPAPGVLTQATLKGFVEGGRLLARVESLC